MQAMDMGSRMISSSRGRTRQRNLTQPSGRADQPFRERSAEGQRPARARAEARTKVHGFGGGPAPAFYQFLRAHPRALLVQAKRPSTSAYPRVARSGKDYHRRANNRRRDRSVSWDRTVV